MKTLEQVKEDLEENVVLNTETGCWDWQGPSTGGYGSYNNPYGSKRTHKAYYEILNGPTGKGVHLHHTCERKICMNPTHLTPLTPKRHIMEHTEYVKECGTCGHIMPPPSPLYKQVCSYCATQSLAYSLYKYYR